MAAEISVEEALVVERAEPPDSGDHDLDSEADRIDAAEAVALDELPEEPEPEHAGEPAGITGEQHEQPEPENPGPPSEHADEGAAALTEARRRRRLRFPPRR
jgi:hypothetical protein